jgi:dTDP-glucose pyrophosphorylase/CBS domain-containing protein
MSEIDRYRIRPEQTVRELLECIDRNATGLALVLDEADRLIDTITDGDIRRAILQSVRLDLPVHAMLERKREPGRTPITAPVDATDAELLELMTEHSLRHVPQVDADGRVVKVALLSALVLDAELPLTAVVMAGGLGTRLRPLTQDLPKPMLPVGDRPVLAHIMGQLRKAGIRHVNVATHYKPETITDHFGDGSRFGVDIDYVQEDTPLGTAGALRLVEWSDQPLLVMNGDILTRVDFGSMLQFHREHQAQLTVAVRDYHVVVPFGVMETDGGAVVRRVQEKPTFSHFVNAGIYLVDPSLRQLLPEGRRYDMTELINDAVTGGHRVVCFPIREYWLDIGQMSDYERAQADHRPEDLAS